MIKKLISLFICCVLIFTAIPLGTFTTAIAAKIVKTGSCGENVTYTLDSDGLLTISGSGPMADFVEYNYKETSSPFSGEKAIKNVVIESGIKSIGDFVFKGCEDLTRVTISGNVVSIGDYAFSDCTGLTKVTIPDNVTSIGNKAFKNCTGLNSITIPNSVTSIGDMAFYGCSGLTNVTIPNSVTSIDEFAFEGCTGLESVTISNSLKTIEWEAFKGCIGLKSVNIPDSVTSIGSSAFYGCTGLKSVTIPNSVTDIGSSAFGGCSGLTSLTIPNSVTSIGGTAFYGCSGLTSLTIPNSVTSIGDSAFCNCSGIEKIKAEQGNTKYHSSGNCLIETEGKTLVIGCKNSIIPDDGSVMSIGDSAFQGCTSLTSMTIPNDVTTIEMEAFDGCSGLTSVTIPNSVTTIGGAAFYGCVGLTNVTIPNSVTTIDWSTFEGCTGLKSVTIPNSVTSIGYGAFWDCTGLKNVIIPNSVTSIGSHAFADCVGLKSMTIPNSVTSIGEKAFEGCVGLDKMEVSEGNTVYHSTGNCIIETKTKTLVAGCKKSVIPDDGSVTSIDEAFSGCTGLKRVIIPNSVTEIAPGAFEGCSGLTSLTIPNSVTYIGWAAFSDCTGLKRVTISDSITSIEYASFYGCTGLTSVTIGNSVTSIGDSAFSDCTGLTSVTIPNSVTTIEREAFEGCSDLKKMAIPPSVTDIGYSAIPPQTMIIGVGGSYAQQWAANNGIKFSPIEASGSFNLKQTAYDASTNPDYDWGYHYKDSYFDHDATVYDPSLATMSLCLAHSTTAEDVIDNSKDLRKQTYGNVEDLLNACGFYGEQYGYVDGNNNYITPTANSVACYIANKTIGDTTLIAVAVRSGGYKKEWSGNFNVGLEGNHKGFDIASDTVISDIQQHIKSNNISGKVKFWVTGFSRGAAVANFTAAKLNKSKVSSAVKYAKDQVYAYCFATPAGSTEKNAQSDTYNNIFNILHHYDVVPLLAPEKWGFKPYGRVLVLPYTGNINVRDYDLMAKMKKRMKDHNVSYVFDDGFIFDTAAFERKLVRHIAGAIGNRTYYYNNFQNYVMEAFNIDGAFDKSRLTEIILSLIESLAGKILTLNPKSLNGALLLTDATDALSYWSVHYNLPIIDAHAEPAYYFSFLHLMDDEYVSDPKVVFAHEAQRFLTINCPVDVYLYDNNHNIAAQIVNEEVTIFNEAVAAYIDSDGQKTFEFSAEDEYSVEFQAREDCDVTYTVNELSDYGMTTERIVNYELSMNENEKATGIIGSLEIADEDFSGSESEYPLTYNGKLIKKDADIKSDSIKEFTYTILAECDDDLGSVSGGGEYTYGSYCCLTATPKGEAVFKGWVDSETGAVLSTDMEYRFEPKSNQTLIASFEINCAPGDVNGDGEVLANDARLALRASAKLETLDDAQTKAADVDGDGQVLANDARQILRFSAKLQDKFEKKQ